MDPEIKAKILTAFKQVFLGEYTVKENIEIKGTRVRYAIHNKFGNLVGAISEKTYQENTDEIKKIIAKAKRFAQEEKEWQEKQEKELVNREAALRAKLPPMPDPPASETNLVRTAEILAEIQDLQKKLARFTGPEDDGIRLSINCQISNLRRELVQYCEHEIKVEYIRDYVSGTNVMRLTRRVYCPKCGWGHSDSVREELPDSIVWR